MKTRSLFKRMFVGIVGYVLLPLTANAQYVSINATNFPDENFRNYLLAQNYGSDGVITDNEIEEIISIGVENKSISSLQGIEFFTSLTNLFCDNNELTSLDVSQNSALTYLSCYSNQLTSLDVSQNSALKYLYCYRNQLTSLDVSGCTALTELWCSENQLTSLDVSNNTLLTDLWCYSNQLTSLDVSNNTLLTNLNCNRNQLTSLDVSQNSALTYLYCYSNQLTSLDVSQNSSLTDLWCDRNQIKGESMDALINSLPLNMTDEIYYFYVYNSWYQDGNVCTKTQVAAAKARGWTPYDSYYWIEYEGSDDGSDGIDAVHIDVEGKNAIYTINGIKLNTTHISDLPSGIYIVNGKKMMVK